MRPARQFAAPMVLKGIEVISRHQKAGEIAVMTEWVWALSPDLRPAVASVFCDSKAEWTFTITCRCAEAPGVWADWYGVLAEVLDRICIERGGGHNGITVEGPAGEYLYDLEPVWLDDLSGLARQKE